MNILSNTLSWAAASTECAGQGALIRRPHWPQDVFVFWRPADELTITSLIQVVRSVPGALKDYYAAKYPSPFKPGTQELATVDFSGYFCRKNADDNIENAWVPTGADKICADWQVVSYGK